MADPRYVTHPDVIYTRLDAEEAVLLNVQTQVYYSVNETGVAVWEMLDQPRSLDEIAAALSEQYDIEPDEARSFAEEFVRDLRRDGLVREH